MSVRLALRQSATWIACVLAGLSVLSIFAANEPAGEGVVRVAALNYAGDKRSDKCFADGFLATVARETDIVVDRRLHPADLASETLFDYPFVILAGEGRFTLSESEQRQLEIYLRQGGFVLASSGCSNRDWARSFRQMIEAMFGEACLEPIAADHPLLHSLYDIERLDVRGRDDAALLYGLTLQGRLRLVFSPAGLNDTANAGVGCCCCGGEEVRNAREVNANILVYALTH